MGEKLTLSIGDTGRSLELPEHWESLETLPEDAPGTVAFGYRSAGSSAVVTLGPLDGQMMPVDRDEVVEGIQPALDEADATLVEVDAGETPAGDLAVYTIVRTEPDDDDEDDEDEEDEAGVQFTLTLNLAVENGEFLQPFLVLGYFSSHGDDQQALDQARDIAGRVITA
ncbi:MAG TPA: hypothetical protein H9870_13040 [Candidatus Corynebacterium avicola]|uniref:Uncharacterized protein n=1 Tax=Candidatus Corynebacterium avicola TaxID=2838527 RepID=A0A9D1RQB6_9CORY|nr:hypothetical protein [Candidatus Corynebacterium avicola]